MAAFKRPVRGTSGLCPRAASYKQGVAAATLTGIAKSRTEVVCAIDCDGTYDPRQLRQMIAMLAPDVDLVTASPIIPKAAC